MDQHYQQISYAKNARCANCDLKRPITIPMRLSKEIVDYCRECFASGVHDFSARAAEYEDISWHGDVMGYRTIPDGEHISGGETFDVFLKYLGCLPERKAAGLDKFHVEFLRHADVAVQQYVYHLLILVLTKRILIDEAARSYFSSRRSHLPT
eukprot:2636614-Rhodomonas_salina.1